MRGPSPGADRGRAGAAPSRIALVGIMGSGKTTVGRRLARLLGYRFVDLDAEIERRRGRGIPAIFRLEGEPEFRRHEAQALKAVSRLHRIVVATGGGAVTRAESRAVLRRRFATFWLRVSAAEAWRRMGTAAGRPLLGARRDGSGLQRPAAGKEIRPRRRGMASKAATVSEPLRALRAMARERAPYYEVVGRPVGAGRPADSVARTILRHLRGGRAPGAQAD